MKPVSANSALENRLAYKGMLVLGEGMNGKGGEQPSSLGPKNIRLCSKSTRNFTKWKSLGRDDTKLKNSKKLARAKN